MSPIHQRFLGAGWKLFHFGATGPTYFAVASSVTPKMSQSQLHAATKKNSTPTNRAKIASIKSLLSSSSSALPYLTPSYATGKVKTAI
jgi:hypothetical protein